VQLRAKAGRKLTPLRRLKLTPLLDLGEGDPGPAKPARMWSPGPGSGVGGVRWRVGAQAEARKGLLRRERQSAEERTPELSATRDCLMAARFDGRSFCHVQRMPYIRCGAIRDAPF
jgi:hypothetical protein